MIYLEDAIKKYNSLPEIAIIEFNKKEVIGKINELENLYKINLSPFIIYVAINELRQAENYLMDELGYKDEKVRAVIDEVNRQILNPVSERLNFLNPDPDKLNISIKQEEGLIVKIFSEKLINELNNYQTIIEAINRRIFYVLSRNLSFQQEIEKALYLNEETFSDKDFIVENNRKKPTVANWLRDFINHFGAKMFDAVELSSYLTNSDNAKKLNDSERQLLIKILNTYRNIKFFPESMPDDDGTNWEIIPVDKMEEETARPKLVIKSPEPIIKEESFGSKRPSGPVDSIQTKPKNPRIEEMKEMAARYRVGSLERKAVEEEIKKIEGGKYA